jgi:hypothetical protein
VIEMQDKRAMMRRGGTNVWVLNRGGDARCCGGKERGCDLLYGVVQPVFGI